MGPSGAATCAGHARGLPRTRRREASFRTVDRFGPAPAAEMAGMPSRSSSTACRNDTPSARITQSITDQPAWHAPRQCHKFFSGLITSDGVESS